MAADFAKAKQTARLLLDEYGIKEPPVNPVEIARSQNIDILYITLPEELSEKISGFYDPLRETRLGKGAIIINKDIPITRMVFTAAHELGHIVLHNGIRNGDRISSVHFRRNNWSQGFKPDIEKEADVFAANLLMPERLIKTFYSRNNDIGLLAFLFCVSEESMRFRLKDLRLL